MKYRASFYEHGCTEEIADYVIGCGRWYQIQNSPRQFEQVMYVGWDQYGDKLWEVALELYPEGEEDWVFHGDVATAFSIKQVRL